MVISGIIRPPPDIRAVADRTALFVAKNGRAFESRILNSDKGRTPKFAFLHDTSPFHAYYEDKVRFYEEGGVDEEEEKEDHKHDDGGKKGKDSEQQQKKEEEGEEEGAKTKKTTSKKTEKAKKASGFDPIARALLMQRSRITASLETAQPPPPADEDEEGRRGSVDEASEMNTNDGDKVGNDDDRTKMTAAAAEQTPTSTAHSGLLKPPPPLQHATISAPANLTSVQIEIIKLTAQFAALSSYGKKGFGGSGAGGGGEGGSSFLKNLALNEWTNPTFAFIQPRHGHFAYFTALVDCYKLELESSCKILQRRKELSRADGTFTLQPQRAGQDNNNDHLEEKLRIIEKCAGNVRNCLEVVAYRTEYDRYRKEKEEEMERTKTATTTTGGILLDKASAYIDWHDFVVVETIDFPVDEVVEVYVMPPPPPPPPQPTAQSKEEKEKEKASDEEMDESSSASSSSEEEEEEEEDDSEQIKVVPNYKPKVVSTQTIAADTSRTHIIDPITGKSIPIANLPEHMRIQLLDPKWAAERKRFLDKQKESNLLGGEDIASNISRLAQARGDIFGSSTEDELLRNEADGKRRREEANRIIREQAIAGTTMTATAQQQVQAQPQPRPSVSFPPAPSAASTTPTASAQSTVKSTAGLPATVQQQQQAQPPPPPPPPPPLLAAPISSTVVTTTGTTMTTQQHDFPTHPKPDLESPQAAKKQKVDSTESTATSTTVPPHPPPLPPMPTAIGADIDAPTVAEGKAHSAPSLSTPVITPGVSPPSTTTTTVSLVSQPLPPPPSATVPTTITSTTPVIDAATTTTNGTTTSTATATETGQRLSEEEFISTLTSPNITLLIHIPDDSSNYPTWQFHGQTISLQTHITQTIKQIKELLSEKHLGNMPVNKMQLKHSQRGFLKDNNVTLAYWNLDNETELDLMPKVRGGRK